MVNITVPAWLAAILGWIAGYLRGRVDQAAADSAAADTAASKDETTVEDAARQVGALNDDTVQSEIDQWRTPSP